MKTNRCTVVFGDGLVGPAFAKERKPVLPPPFPYFTSYVQDGGEHLWGANVSSFARITLRDGYVERNPDFITARPTTFQARGGVWSAGGGRLVVQNFTGVWLLEMPAQADK